MFNIAEINKTIYFYNKVMLLKTFNAGLNPIDEILSNNFTNINTFS